MASRTPATLCALPRLSRTTTAPCQSHRREHLFHIEQEHFAISGSGHIHRGQGGGRGRSTLRGCSHFRPSSLGCGHAPVALLARAHRAGSWRGCPRSHPQRQGPRAAAPLPCSCHCARSAWMRSSSRSLAKRSAFFACELQALECPAERGRAQRRRVDFEFLGQGLCAYSSSVASGSSATRLFESSGFHLLGGLACGGAPPPRGLGLRLFLSRMSRSKSRTKERLTPKRSAICGRVPSCFCHALQTRSRKSIE